MSNNDNNDDGINITLGKLVAYPIGILLILSSIGASTSSILASVLLFVSGLIALPIVRSRLKDNTGIGINRWAASAIVLVLMISGGALLPTDGSSGGLDSGDNSGGETEIIEQSAGELVPTIDAFESGWRGSANEDGTGTFAGPDGDKAVSYNVTVYDNSDEAQTALESQNPENTATDDTNLGDSGFKYQITENAYRIVFRERNAVCETTYQGGIATFGDEGNADSHARKCLDAING